MFHILSKLLSPLLEPLNWFVLGGAVAVWKSRGALRRWLLGGWVLLLVLSNPWPVEFVLRAWEITEYPADARPGSYDAIVLLGGGLVLVRDKAGDDVHIGEASDRMFQAWRLLKAGVAPRIVMCSNADQLLSKKPAETVVARQTLLAMGIPDSAILLGPSARSTWEEAAGTAAVMQRQLELFPRKRLLLITSALHLRRAVWCFQRHGLSVTPYPADLRSMGELPDTTASWFLSLFPCSEALSSWSQLIHEWVGMLMYRLRH